MNTQIYANDQHPPGSIHKIVLALLLLLTSSLVLAAGSFQQNLLLTPSKNMLLAEVDGRVMIYDGLKSETIDKAMDEQFNRIDKMMFVSTLYKQKNGEYKTEEGDDCD